MGEPASNPGCAGNAAGGMNEAHELEKMAPRLENYLLRKGIAPLPEDNP